MSLPRKIKVYLEVGQKRTFAGALDWPGWCRSGRDTEAALEALLEYGPRYARLLRSTRLGFKAPADVSSLDVVERLKGNATTDFGAPALAPSQDADPISPQELRRLETILRACLRTFEANVASAEGETLETGPRGGGRQVQGIVEHVVGSNAGYLNQVGWKFQRDTNAGVAHPIEESREALLQALRASARGEIPAQGPRGGVRWSARYFVRRVAWHVLDHAWEIEDRVIPA